MRLLLPTLVLLVLLSGVALAHTPFYLRAKEGEVVHQAPLIDDPENAMAFYGHIAPRGDGARAPGAAAAKAAGAPRRHAPRGAPTAEVLPIDAEEDQVIKLHISVPQRKGLETFRPKVVLVGPGLPEPVPADLPVEAKEGDGALTLPDADPEPSFEPFMQVSYWGYGRLIDIFPKTGRYALVVYDPQGVGGPYTLSVGKHERFGVKDVLTLPLVWARTRIWLWK